MQINDLFVQGSFIPIILTRIIPNAFNNFFYGNNRIGAKALVIYITISYFFYLFDLFKTKKFNPENFFGYLLPKKIYSHPSTKMDLKVFFVNLFLNPGEFLIFSMVTVMISVGISEKLGCLGIQTGLKLELNKLNLFFISLIGFLIYDFSNYISHLVLHKVSFLWPFHATHHSAEVLNPLTVERGHFFESIIIELTNCLFFGIGQGILIWVTLGSIDPNLLLNYFLLLNLFNYLLANFRHSHFWISFGFLNRLFISPAMHQIHHSADKKHRNKNFGVFLSIWDQIFGTIYLPKEKENLIYGIEKGVKNPHDTLLKFYLVPFKESGIVLKNKVEKLRSFFIPQANKGLLKGTMQFKD